VLSFTPRSVKKMQSFFPSFSQFFATLNYLFGEEGKETLRHKKQYFFYSQKPTGKSNSSFLPEQSELTKNFRPFQVVNRGTALQSTKGGGL
jgi:hypothetical protein